MRLTRDARERIAADLMRDISVGARLNWDSITLDNEDDMDSWESIDEAKFTAHEWMAVESSLTPIPADSEAGLDREDVLDLLREDDELVIFGAGQAIMSRRAADTHRPRLESLIETRNPGRGKTMVTQQLPADEVIERLVTNHLQNNGTLQRLTEIPDKVDKLSETLDYERGEIMKLGQKLNTIQFQPGGRVLQLENWQPGERMLDLGKVLRLTAAEDVIGYKARVMEDSTLEESVIERAELGNPGRNVVGRIPWLALQEEANQRRAMLQRDTDMADAAGARPLDIHVIGDAGLLLSQWAPILGRLDVRMGVVGGQKLPWLTSQPTAPAIAEGGTISATTLTVDNNEILPKTIAGAFQLTSALRDVDNNVFDSIARYAIFEVLQDSVLSQVLVGGGSNEIAGLWGTAGVQNVNYGSAATDFDRADALDFLDNVRLAKTDGGVYTGVLSTALWKLAEGVLRGGTASDTYLLEIDRMGMGRMEGEAMFHYADLSPAGVNDPGLFFKGDRVVVWLYGNSLGLEYVPSQDANEYYKLVASVNMRVQRPAENVSRIKRGA